MEANEKKKRNGTERVKPGNGQARFQPILREDAARCVVEAISKPELLSTIVELGGAEVVTFESMLDWFIQARGIKKPKLKLPTTLLIPCAMAMEAMLANPIVTPDEINTLQLDNIADGIDAVSARFGWRPTRPSQWAQENWKKKTRVR